jgi:hypothetical protein
MLDSSHAKVRRNRQSVRTRPDYGYGRTAKHSSSRYLSQGCQTGSVLFKASRTICVDVRQTSLVKPRLVNQRPGFFFAPAQRTAPVVCQAGAVKSHLRGADGKARLAVVGFAEAVVKDRAVTILQRW